MTRPVIPKQTSPVAAASGNDKGQPVTQFQQTAFSGPIPPPTVLEGYERLVKGAAERILVMAESDAKHQQEIEIAALRATEAEIKRGQWFGFMIGLTALAASMLALQMGSPTVAGVIGGATVVGLVSAFILGRVIK